MLLHGFRYFIGLAIVLLAIGVWVKYCPSKSRDNQEKHLPTHGRGVYLTTEDTHSAAVREVPSGSDHRSHPMSLPSRHPELRRHPALPPGTSFIAGKVVDIAGQPIAGGAIGAYSTAASESVDPSPLSEVSSRADGQFELRISGPDEIELRVDAPGFARLRERIRLRPAVRLNRQFTLLKAEARLEGQVVDAFRKEPIAGAKVQLTLVFDARDELKTDLMPLVARREITLARGLTDQIVLRLSPAR